MKQLFLLLFAFVCIGINAQVTPATVVTGSNSGDGELKAAITALNAADQELQTTPNITGAATFASTISMGAFGDATQTVMSEASSNTNAQLGIYPMINFAGTAGKVFAGTLNRTLAITTNQTNNVSIYGAQNQFRLKGVNLGQGVFAGEWAYAEQSGTSVLSGGAYFAGLSAAVASDATFTAGASEHIVGIVVDGGINAGASGTINGSANFAGIYIKSSGLDFYDGIHITGATNDIKLQNGGLISNSHADTIFMTETAVSVHGALHVTGAITAVGNCCADYAITDYQLPLDKYWAKTLKLNKLPAFENKNRQNVMQYINGVEEANERNLRYIVELEARLQELEMKFKE